MWWGGPRTPKRWPGCRRRTTRSRRARPSGWPSAPRTCSAPGPGSDAPGLDVSGLAGVIAVDVAPGRHGHRRRAGHVHLRGPRRRHAAARLHPATSSRSCAASPSVARSPVSASSRRRSATGCRTSRCSRWTCSPAPARSSRTTPGEDLFDAFPNSYGSLGYATRLRIRLEQVPAYVDLRHLRFDDLDALAKTIERDRRAGRARRRPGRRARRRGVRAGGGLPHAGHLATDRPAGRRATSATTPGMDLYFRSLQQRETDTADDVRLPLALGHRLVLVLGRVRPAEPADPPALAAALAAQRRLQPAHRRWRTASAWPPASTGRAASPSASG